MELNGALSTPPSTGKDLQIAGALKVKGKALGRVAPPEMPIRRLQGHRQGAVLGAVTEVLADGAPRPLNEIHTAVERLLGGFGTGCDGEKCAVRVLRARRAAFLPGGSRRLPASVSVDCPDGVVDGVPDAEDLGGKAEADPEDFVADEIVGRRDARDQCAECDGRGGYQTNDGRGDLAALECVSDEHRQHLHLLT